MSLTLAQLTRFHQMDDCYSRNHPTNIERNARSSGPTHALPVSQQSPRPAGGSEPDSYLLSPDGVMQSLKGLRISKLLQQVD